MVLLEAEAVGAGMTAGDAGLLREGFAGSFRDVSATHGLKTSRNVWNTLRRGSLDFAAALRRYRIACDLDGQDLLTLASTRADVAGMLRREAQARRDAGVEGAWITPSIVARETAVEGAGGIRTHGAVIDPYRACAGLVAAASARGARVYERSLVRRIRPSKRHVDIHLDGASVRAETVVIATAAPIPDLAPLRRHLRGEHAYGVVTEPLPAAMRRQVGGRRAVLEDAGEPGRLVRWLPGDRVLVHGARQPEVPGRGRDRAVTQRAGQLMYELLLMYPVISGLRAEQAWDGIDYETADGLPFLGPHRNFPRHLFAFGSSRHGAGLSWTAARLALRHVLGEPAREDEALGFPRIL